MVAGRWEGQKVDCHTRTMGGTPSTCDGERPAKHLRGERDRPLCCEYLKIHGEKGCFTGRWISIWAASAHVKRISWHLEQVIRLVGIYAVVPPAAYVLGNRGHGPWRGPASFLCRWLFFRFRALMYTGKCAGRVRKEPISSFFLRGAMWPAYSAISFFLSGCCMDVRIRPSGGLSKGTRRPLTAWDKPASRTSLQADIFSGKLLWGWWLLRWRPGTSPASANVLPARNGIYTIYGTAFIMKRGSRWYLLSGKAPKVVFAGSSPLATRVLFQQLRERGNVVMIFLDVPWEKSRPGSFERPFAGNKYRVFAT